MKSVRKRCPHGVDESQKCEHQSLDAQRSRLAQLIGRLLARHWLKRNEIADTANDSNQTGTLSAT